MVNERVAEWEGKEAMTILIVLPPHSTRAAHGLYEEGQELLMGSMRKEQAGVATREKSMLVRTGLEPKKKFFLENSGEQLSP